MSSHCTCIDPESQCAFCALEIKVERLREALRVVRARQDMPTSDFETVRAAARRRAGLRREGDAEAERLRAEVEVLREALHTIVTISKKCNCDAYGGPCGCGDRAGDIAEEALKNR